MTIAEPHPNVLVVSPTGSGKTVTMGALISHLDAPQAAIAHRQELVGQISLALARNGLRHGIVGSDSTVRAIRLAHMEEIGINYVDQNGWTKVCGIDTLNKLPDSDPWFKSVRRVHNDEAHHVTTANKWGVGRNRFVNADSIGYTATPIRGDGLGLGRGWDGIYDMLIEGPTMRNLIEMGFLTDYRLVTAGVADLDLSKVKTGASGDFVYEQVRKAVHNSKEIVGDVVKAYLAYARGKLGVTFAVDIEAATEIAAAYRAAGVPAEIVTGKTPDALRRHILRRFKNREILQLVNVDLFGEGFDLPAIEVVSMARPTESFSLYCQQFGRALRLMIPDHLAAGWGDMTDAQRVYYISQSAKPSAIIIDHVSNWVRHNLPDKLGRVWTLERRSKRASVDPDMIGLRSCLNPEPQADGALCLRPYERYLTSCPYCGHEPQPGGRGTPEMVDGDVGELDHSVLEQLRGAAESVDAPAKLPTHMPMAVQMGAANRHIERREAINKLRDAIALWGAGRSYRSPKPLTTREQQKLFYLTFGIDVLTAQALTRVDAEALLSKVQNKITLDNVVAAA